MNNRYCLKANGSWSKWSTSTYFDEVRSVLSKLPYGSIEGAIDALAHIYETGRTLYLFGNGGSAALASHFACDLGKGTSDVARPRFRVISLTDNMPLITACANDFGYEHVFSEQLKNLLEEGDIAFAISGSGNSPNVLQGLRTARERKATTIGLTGFQGGRMKPLCDLCVIIPTTNMQIIEDLHLSITHAVFTAIKKRLETRNRLPVTLEAWPKAASAD